MTNLTLRISGMSCGHCVAAVSSALKSIDGVQAAEVKIGSATVQFDESRVTAPQLAAAVTEEGYLATVGA